MIACQKNNLEIVKLLLKHNANVNATNHRKVTPLMVAVKNGNKMLSELLLKNKANPNVSNARGISLIEMVHDKDLKALLLKYGAKEVNKDIDGKRRVE